MIMVMEKSKKKDYKGERGREEGKMWHVREA
jgi:hypothetical protein